MFDHVEVPVSDLAASAAFYRTVLEPLGLGEGSVSDDLAEFGALTLVPRTQRERAHVAFLAESEEEVRAFHRRGVEAGYRDNGPPGLRSYWVGRGLVRRG